MVLACVASNAGQGWKTGGGHKFVRNRPGGSTTPGGHPRLNVGQRGAESAAPKRGAGRHGSFLALEADGSRIAQSR
jgi:hypothetical protein